MRRAIGISSYHNSVNSVARTRQALEDEEQAEYLRKWVEARKRRQRLQIVPRTEVTEENTMQRIERAMYLVGLPCGVLALLLTIFLLIVHFGWWTIPAIASAAGLHWLWKGAF